MADIRRTSRALSGQLSSSRRARRAWRLARPKLEDLAEENSGILPIKTTHKILRDASRAIHHSCDPSCHTRALPLPRIQVHPKASNRTALDARMIQVSRCRNRHVHIQVISTWLQRKALPVTARAHLCTQHRVHIIALYSDKWRTRPLRSASRL